mmetsp:Transcript_67575/g.100213  ORF Transcript_67575/g.100213 Transcript_67575/m.100213 type:complete len:394 (-) Transcript_67575:158-1339(-)
MDRSMKLSCLDELKALKAMFFYKKAIYHLAALEFAEAAVAYEASQQIYKAAGRRSLGPSMAMKAAQCYIISDKPGSKENIERMVAEVTTYKEMDKSNWGSPDRQSFREHSEYEDLFGGNNGDDSVLQKQKASWSLLKIAAGMTIVQRCTIWMSPEEALTFAKMIDEMGFESNPDDALLAHASIALMHSHQHSIGLGIARCKKALKLSSQVGEPTRKFGTIQMLHNLAGHFYVLKGKIQLAQDSLASAELNVTKDVVLHHYLSFKNSQLRSKIKTTIEEEFEKLYVPAGKVAVITIESQDSSRFNVGWDWFLQDRDIDFNVRFKPKGGKYQRDIVKKTRQTAESRHVEGSFASEGGEGGDILELTFSNKYSFLRGKTIIYKLDFPTNAKKNISL